MIMNKRFSGLCNGLLIFFLVLVWAASPAFGLPVTANAGDSDKEAAALSAAEKWLALVDDGKYIESWKQAAGYFKNVVKQEQWEQAMQSVRGPLGKLISRKVITATYRTSLPGAPDGEYVIIRFETSFENKKSAVETVTPMMDNDGKWRVSGYYIN